MFRPINSDDHTRFRPPAEHVKQTEATYQGQKRDFAYEVEQVKEEHKEHRERRDEPFGEDTFESSSEQEKEVQDDELKRTAKDRIPPAPGHVDFQI